MSMMVSFVLSFFPRDVLDEILNLIESVSEDFLTTLEQLTHAMSRYHWNIVGLCEMRWKNFGEMSTDDRHKVYFSGEKGKK